MRLRSCESQVLLLSNKREAREHISVCVSSPKSSLGPQEKQQDNPATPYSHANAGSNNFLLRRLVQRKTH